MTKLSGNISGAVWALLMVLSLCASLGKAAPAGTATSSSPSNCMTQWLSSLGLGAENVSSYASIFHGEGVTEQALRLLTLQDLQSIGIETFGHRALIHNSLQQEGATISCINGGVCNPVPDEDLSFQCVCLEGFSGNSCENVVSCSSHVCLNGGTCVESVGKQVECQCPTGYSGLRCEQDPCHSSPCLNGGTCSSSSSNGGSYDCSCPIGYSGDNCETAWLTESAYTAFKGKTTADVRFLQTLYLHLSSRITTMKEEIKEASLEGKGPRFFSHWTTLEGSNAILHMEHFTESGNEYLTMLYSNGSINTYNLAASDNHHVLQTLTIADAASFVLFKISNVLYLAVAKNSTSSNSEVYQWSSSDEQFIYSSSLSTRGARDVTFVSTPQHGDYLIFACHHKTPRFDHPSYVYKWVSGRFLAYQHLQMVTNALTVDSVVTSGDDVLLVLTHAMENGNPTTVVYRWNETYYFDDRTEQRQAISIASQKIFTIGINTFLVGLSSSDSSVVKIFKYNSQTKRFAEYTSIDTPGEINAVEYFHTNTEHFLSLTNFIKSQESSPNGVPLNRHHDVLVYKIDGAGCKLFQEIQTSFRPSCLRRFSRGECKGVAIAGSSGMTELQQWSDMLNQC